MNVRAWLEGFGLEEHAAAFDENGVDGDLLAELTNDDLKDLGIQKLGDRKRLLKAIEKLAGDGPPLEPQIITAPPPEGERRQLTIFFADLSGYTELTDALDAEELHELMGFVFDSIDRIIEDHGGTVHRHVGDEVMALFGTPVAHTDDPMRAVRAAFETHRAMTALGIKQGRNLAVHIGIASGSVIVAGQGTENPEDVTGYAVTGAAANLAARLNSLADPGETIISDTVHQVVEAEIDCSPLGETAVKGFEKPVVPWRTLAVRSDGAARSQSPLIGRRAETAQFNGALQSCRETGMGQAMLVRGEAGMGKTRLVREFEANAEKLGFACHKSLNFDFGVGEGQDAIRTLVYSLLGVAADSDIPAREAGAAVALDGELYAPDQQVFLNDLLNLPQPAELQGIYDAMNNAARHQGKHALLTGLIQCLSRRQPLLLVIEDVHWADGEALSDLAQITIAVQESPALLVMTSRIEGDPLDQSWRSRAGGAPLLTIGIGPLRQAESAQMAAAFASAIDEYAQNCIERAGGNPLFLEQLLRSAEESRDGDVPATIQSLILTRIDRLAGPDKGALQAASAIGQRFALNTLQALVDDPEYSCAKLIEHNLVRPDGDDYLFAHALIQEGVYASLLKDRRGRLHLGAAKWFADRDPMLHAEHLDRADDVGAAAAYQHAAAVQAQSYHYEQALRLIERGLELAAEGADKFQLTCMKGQMLHDLGSIEPSVEAYNEALELAEDDIGRCRAWLGLAAGLRIADRYDEALEILGKAEVAASGNGLVRESAEIHHIRGNLYFPMGRFEDCAAEHEKSLEYAKQAGSAEAETNALGGIADASYVAGRMATAHQYFGRCVAVARQNGFVGIEVVNGSMVGFTRIYLNELSEALENGLTTIVTARKVGHQRAEMLGEVLASQVLFVMADHAGTRQHNSRVMELAGQLGARRFEAQGLIYEGKLALVEGRRDVAIKHLEAARAISEDVGHGFAGPGIMGALALSLDEPDAKYDALDEGGRMLEAGSVSHNHFLFYPDAIDISLDAGDWDRAEGYCAALEEFSLAEPLPWSEFYIARGRTLAALGRNRRDQELTQEMERLCNLAAQANIATALPALQAALISL